MAQKLLKLSAGIVIAAALFAPAAQAQEFEVRYKKTELTSFDGAVQVYQRIYETAQAHCDYQFKTFSSSKTRTRYDRCLRRTVKEIVGQIDHPNIDRAYAALPVKRIRGRADEAVLLAANQGR